MCQSTMIFSSCICNKIEFVTGLHRMSYAVLVGGGSYINVDVAENERVSRGRDV